MRGVITIFIIHPLLVSHTGTFDEAISVFFFFRYVLRNIGVKYTHILALFCKNKD